MSRIGKKEIVIPGSVNVDLKGNTLEVKGPKGSLTQTISEYIDTNIQDGRITLTIKGEPTKTAAKLYGLSRTLVANMVHGVSETFNKKLELQGVGYRASVNGKKLILNVGYSHPVEINPPEGISFEVQNSLITVTGIDKSVVGESAAKIRSVRPPEPYKGKGIRHLGEKVKRKAGKSGKK